MTRKFLSSILLFCSLSIFAQTKIMISNKSFEDFPRQGSNFLSLGGWTDCGGFRFPGQSPPDVHPGNFWSNNTPPSHGNSYLGMVVRDNETYEGVGQRLTTSLKVGKCYKFTIDLARSTKYLSKSQKTDLETNYIVPAVLRVWAGNGICDDRELIGESAVVSHEEWRTYQFKVKPKSDYQFIMIEAFYKVPVIVPYCGHILVDNLSDFDEMDCEAKLAAVVSKVTGKSIVDASPAKVALPPHKRNRLENEKPPVVQNNSTQKPSGQVTPPVASSKAKVLEDLDIKKIKTGAIINVKNLYFKADTSTIDKDSYGVLDEIYEFLKSNKNVKVEIGGHTNGIPPHDYCDKLSSIRAKAVYDYLVSKGIPKEQLTFHGYGKRALIASDSTPAGRTKNQRVELKVLSLG
jgi:outer membrane protein OmpA-like peptidoglycan-associated protein